MSDLTYLVIKFGFLALLWGFVAAVVFALRSDLFGQAARRVTAPAGQPARPTPAAAQTTLPMIDAPRADSSDARRLVIVAGPKEGLELDLPSEQLTIGRASDSGLIVRDDYTSSHHARLLKWPNGWVIQDLDSTNGTFVDGSRVHGPTEVALGARVTIGSTSFELRR